MSQNDPTPPQQDVWQVVLSEVWEPNLGFVCRVCGDVARIHPQTNHIWGCLKCNMTTASVSLFFDRVPAAAPQAVQPEELARQIVKTIDDEINEEIDDSAEHLPAASPLDIDQLQKLWEASTPGEWRQGNTSGSRGYVYRPTDGFRVDDATSPCADAAFIAAAHNAFPKLLAAIRESRKQIDDFWEEGKEAEHMLLQHGEQIADLQAQFTAFRALLQEAAARLRFLGGDQELRERIEDAIGKG